jgi:hypothetical protein
MATYFPFSHVIGGDRGSKEIHPFFSGWSVSGREDGERNSLLSHISELFY